MEIPIHQMSVTGMIIALGLLIDNAIVAVDEVTMAIQGNGSSRMGAVREHGQAPRDSVAGVDRHDRTWRSRRSP